MHQTWYSGSSRGHNQLWQLFGNQLKGLDSLGPKFAISYSFSRAPLTQCWRYRGARDDDSKRDANTRSVASAASVIGCTTQPVLDLNAASVAVNSWIRSNIHLDIFLAKSLFYPNVTTLRSGLCCRNSVCLSSVTLVHPTQGLNVSAKFLHRCVRWPSADLCAKFYGDSPKETSPLRALNSRGVSKYSDFCLIEGYIS